MKKVFKIFKIAQGVKPSSFAYYDSTPSQIEDVTHEISDKSEFVSEKSAINALSKNEDVDREFLILAVYIK